MVAFQSATNFKNVQKKDIFIDPVPRNEAVTPIHIAYLDVFSLCLRHIQKFRKMIISGGAAIPP